MVAVNSIYGGDLESVLVVSFEFPPANPLVAVDVVEVRGVSATGH